MRLAFIRWGYPHEEGILRAWERAGVIVEVLCLPESGLSQYGMGSGPEQERSFQKHLQSAGEMVFSVNFIASISQICMKMGKVYISWTLQLPDYDLYTSAMRNPVNLLYVCDSCLTDRLRQAGAGMCFYLPEAVETRKEQPGDAFVRGICCIAGQYEDKIRTEEMSLYARGYVDAFVQSQMVLFGRYELEKGLPSKIRQELRKGNPVPAAILPELAMLYTADRYLAPAASRLQQEDLWRGFASSTTVYSGTELVNCPASVAFLKEDTETERAGHYKEMEFSLSLAPHVLHDGIPRQTLEIIAAGGFPLAGFQKDYAYFFRQGVDLAWFTDGDELVRTMLFYGNDPEARERVRRAAWETVMREHTYDNRIEAILEHIEGSRELPVPMEMMPSGQSMGSVEKKEIKEKPPEAGENVNVQDSLVRIEDIHSVSGVVIEGEKKEDKGIYRGRTPHICRICGTSGDFDTYLVREMMQGTREEFVYFVCDVCHCMQIEEVPGNLSQYYGKGYYSFRVEERPNMQFETPVIDDSKILDVGCGSGWWLLNKAVEGCGNLYGCDPFLEKGRTYGDRVTIYNCSIHEMEGDGSFDEIYMQDSFEHMTDPLAVLKSARRLLTPEGILTMKIPTYPNIAFERYGTHWYQLDAPRHIFLHSKESLAWLSKESGMEIVKYQYDSNNGQFVKSFLYQQGISFHKQAGFIGQYFSQQDLEKLEEESRAWNQKEFGDHMEVLWMKNGD